MIKLHGLRRFGFSLVSIQVLQHPGAKRLGQSAQIPQQPPAQSRIWPNRCLTPTRDALL